MEKIRLSPSGLNLFRECPRCFWLEKKKGIKRPAGIFPSLPGGMDLVIKAYFDKYRMQRTLPPELKSRIPGELFSDIIILRKWRSWRATDLYYEDKKLNITLSGALDDCLIEDGFYVPLDYKTRGSELKEDPRQYYQTQLDSYCLMLDASGFKTKNLAYLLYYWPLEVRESGIVKFHVEPIRVETNMDAVKKILSDAISILNSDIPQPSWKCEYCALVADRKNESFTKNRKV
ncbi:MAG: PD-(D/E)XK nuclease family protein [Candidatus Omnitrophota bacterium]